MFADQTTIPLIALYRAGTDPAVTHTDGRITPGIMWLDTSTGATGTLKKRNEANSGWDTLINLDAPTVANDGITNAKLANMATQTIKGRTTAGTGDPEDLTATQATAILNTVVGDSGSGGTKGIVPAPGAGDAAAGKFLKADGTFAVPSGGGGTPGGSDTQFQYNNAGGFGGAGELKRVTGGNGPKVQFDGGANAAWLQIKANSGSTYLTSEGADGVGFHTGEDYGNTNLGNTWVNISRVVQLKAQGQGNDPTASGFGIIYFREQALKLKYSEDGATAKELTPRRGSTTWNPASLGDGAVESTTVTVSGVVVGDPCFASLSTIGSNNFQITAHVESSDTVRVVLRNVSGGTVDLASGTLNVLCWKA